MRPAEFRIVRDRFAGYEVQRKTWWWPFWRQGAANTHDSLFDAEEYARRWAKGDPRVVRYLGPISNRP